MKRALQFAALFAWALFVGTLGAQTPGSLVVTHWSVAGNGCFAGFNNPKWLKQSNLCSFDIVAPGVQVTGLACNAVVSDAVGGGQDTVLNCTYDPNPKLTKLKTRPLGNAWTYVLPTEDIAIGPNGCSPVLNHPALRCGFNIVLSGLAVPNVTFVVTVDIEKTTLEVMYPPIVQGTPSQ